MFFHTELITAVQCSLVLLLCFHFLEIANHEFAEYEGGERKRRGKRMKRTRRREEEEEEEEEEENE